VLTLLVGLVAWAGVVSAQTLTGTIAGKVMDEQGGVLPGVTVTLTGSQGSQTQVTDAKGEFRFIGLTPGTYSVKSELEGFRRKEQQGIVVSIGKTADIALPMAVGGLSETVDVVANAVTIDTTTTATDTNLSQDLLFAMPISHNNPATSIMNYAPGVNGGSAFGAAAGSANALMLDGVDTRDPSGNTSWAFFNYNIIDEVQLGGLGQPAEYGGFSGAVVNTITKSGGNRFSHLSEMRFTNKSLSGDNTTEEIKALNPGLADPGLTKSMSDYTVQMGGPVLRDKLFFFGSVQRYSLNTDPTGPRTKSTEVSPRLNLKFTAQPTPSDTITASMQYDAYNIVGRTGVIPARAALDWQTRTEEAPDWIWNAQYRKVLGSSAFFEAKFMGYTGYYDLTPLDLTPGHYDGDTGAYSGGASWISQHDRGRNQLNASVSKYARAAGTHNFKFGVEIERSTVRERFEYAGGVYYYDYGGEPYIAYNYSYDLKGKNKRESFYAQDQWKMSRFTASLGVRADRIRGDASATGKELFSTFSVAPRLGLVWDLTGKGTSVVRGFYGQLVDGPDYNIYDRAVPGLTDTTYWTVGPNWSTLIPDYVVPAVNKYSVATGLKQPRTDEVSVAWEQQFGQTMKFSATGIWRDTKNFLNSTLNNAVWAPISYVNPLTNQPMTLYKWANRASIPQQFTIQNVGDVRYTLSSGSQLAANPYRHYKGLMLMLQRANKNRWQGQVSYVLSKTEGTVSNTGGSGIRSGQFETPNGILVNSDGYADYDRRHELKVFAGYQIPVIEVSVSAYYRAVSGYNYTPYASVPRKTLDWTGNLSVLLEPRGSRNNDFDSQVDLRLEKVVNFGIHRVGFYADVSNLTNASIVSGRQTRVPSTSILGKTVVFGSPTSLVPGRQAILGLRWSF
jgi:hypothetical protein